MPLRETLVRTRSFMCGFKREWVREHAGTASTISGTEPTDMPLTAVLLRGGEPIARILHPGDLVSFLAELTLAVDGFDPDVAIAITESWRPDVERYPAHPITGQPWASLSCSEVIYELLQQGARERGWIQDALVATVVTRAGDVGILTSTYRIVEGDLRWLEHWSVCSLDDPEDVAGPLTESMREIMNRRSILAHMAACGLPTMVPGVDIDVATSQHDCDTAQVLIDQGEHVLLVAAAGSRREQIIRHHFPGQVCTLTAPEPFDGT